jgi:hypothetical protein
MALLRVAASRPKCRARFCNLSADYCQPTARPMSGTRRRKAAMLFSLLASVSTALDSGSAAHAPAFVRPGPRQNRAHVSSARAVTAPAHPLRAVPSWLSCTYQLHVHDVHHRHADWSTFMVPAYFLSRSPGVSLLSDFPEKVLSAQFCAILPKQQVVLLAM